MIRMFKNKYYRLYQRVNKLINYKTEYLFFRSKSLNLSIIPEYARFLASKNVNGVLGEINNNFTNNNYLETFKVD